MRIAKDGKEFDIDNIEVDTPSGHIEVIQFLRPNGRRRRMTFLATSDEIIEMQKDMILSCEELTTGEVACYVRFIDEDENHEYLDFAVNGPGDKNPTAVLENLIRKKMKNRTDFVLMKEKANEQ